MANGLQVLSDHKDATYLAGCEEAHLSLKQFHLWLTLIERQTEPNKLRKKPELFLFSPFYILFFGDVCYLVSVPASPSPASA